MSERQNTLSNRSSDDDEISDDQPAPSDRKFRKAKGLHASILTMVDDYMDDVIWPASKTHKQQLRTLAEQIKDSLHPAISYDCTQWSQEDEDNVLAQWEAEKDHWLKLYDRKRYLGLWKISLQFADCTPWDIVGERTKLSFELIDRTGIRDGNDDLIKGNWSTHFIRCLASLIVHPAWSGINTSVADYLATAIQYAVILRTNDQRPWDLKHLGGEFFTLFHDICRTRCPCLMANIHKEVIKRMTGDVPVISFVFQSMEKEIKGPDEPLLDDGPYFVMTADLTNLIKALDHTVNPRTHFNLFMPVAVLYETAKVGRGGNPPPSMAQLDEYHKLAVIEEFRRKVKASRHAQPPEAADDPFVDDDQVVPLVSSPGSIVAPRGQQSQVSRPISPSEEGCSQGVVGNQDDEEQYMLPGSSPGQQRRSHVSETPFYAPVSSPSFRPGETYARRTPWRQEDEGGLSPYIPVSSPSFRPGESYARSIPAREEDEEDDFSLRPVADNDGELDGTDDILSLHDELPSD